MRTERGPQHRTVVYLGELNSSVEFAWRRAISVFNQEGGECQLEIFAGCEHQWVAEPGPQTDRAHEMVKAFIARQLQALRLAA